MIESTCTTFRLTFIVNVSDDGKMFRRILKHKYLAKVSPKYFHVPLALSNFSRSGPWLISCRQMSFYDTDKWSPTYIATWYSIRTISMEKIQNDTRLHKGPVNGCADVVLFHSCTLSIYIWHRRSESVSECLYIMLIFCLIHNR